MQSSYRNLIKLYNDREYSGNYISLSNISHSCICSLEVFSGINGSVVEPALSVCGTNMANCNSFLHNSQVTDIITTADSITVTKAKTQGANGFCGVLIRVKPNTKYFIRKPTVTPEVSNNVRVGFRLYEYDAKPDNNDFLQSYKNVQMFTTDTVINTGDCTNCIAVVIQLGAAYEATAVLENVMVSLIDVPYVPYSEQTLTVPYTLHSIPVASGGNYTDENGQEWLCDTYNPIAGEYVQRVGVELPITTTFEPVNVKGNIPCTAMCLDNDNGIIKAILQTKE